MVCIIRIVVICFASFVRNVVEDLVVVLSLSTKPFSIWLSATWRTNFESYVVQGFEPQKP